MGFLDLLRRLGSGLQQGAQDFATFNQEADAYDRLGPNFREFQRNDLLTSRFQLSGAESRATSAENQADISTRSNTTSRREFEESERYTEMMGRMVETGDVDSSNFSVEEYKQAGVRAQADQDRERSDLSARAQAGRDETSLIKTDDFAEHGLADIEAGRADRKVDDANSREQLESAKRRNALDERFALDERLHNQRMGNLAEDRSELALDVAKGTSPKSRKDVKSGAAEGFDNRVERLVTANREATDEILAEISRQSSAQVRALAEISFNGMIGLVGPNGPMTEQDLNQAMANSKTLGGIQEALKQMGFKMDQTGNTSMGLLQQLAQKPVVFQEQQTKAVAEGAVRNFEVTFPGVLHAAAEGLLLDPLQQDAMDLLIDTLEKVQGTDFTKYPRKALDAVRGINDRKVEEPNGAVK